MSALKFIPTFAVVKALYGTFDGTFEVGLFVVTYTDGSDKDILFKQNLLGLKITSKPSMMDKYFITIQKFQFPTLEKTSWIQCNRLHTLAVSGCDQLGMLPPELCVEVADKLNMFFAETAREMITSIPIERK